MHSVSQVAAQESASEGGASIRCTVDITKYALNCDAMSMQCNPVRIAACDCCTHRYMIVVNLFVFVDCALVRSRYLAW